MSFYSVFLFIFILLFIHIHRIAYRFIPRHQWVIRLIASIIFYTVVSGFRIIALLFSALTVWGGALLTDRIRTVSKERRSLPGLSSEEKKAIKKSCRNKERLLLFLVILFNTGLLIALKHVLPVVLYPIALPLGISFYTLQAVSYTVDVYGKKYAPCKNPAKVLLYLMWFPQITIGPINRFDEIQEDLFRPYRLDPLEGRYAVYLFLFGALKKYALGDLLAPAVNAALNGSSAAYPGSFLLFGALIYAVRQYADFSGGIDMAMAVSMLFGVRMARNFRQPYFASSLSDFWRRWHISLGAWMRDYVFYPFATSKPVSKLMKYTTKHFGDHAARSVCGGLGNLLVFALVGLWHGHELHFLAWGLYNGVIIALGDAFSPLFSGLYRRIGIREDSRPLRYFRMIRTFMIVVLAGYFDVIDSVRMGLSAFGNTFFRFGLSEGAAMIRNLYAGDMSLQLAMWPAGITLILLFANSIFEEKGISPLRRVTARRYYIRWPVFFCLLNLLFYSFTVSSGIRDFMYAAF